MEAFVPRHKDVYGPILPQFVLNKRITFGAKVIYALLCNYASSYDCDHCCPSHSTLAKRLSCSITSVKNYLIELTDANLIRIECRVRNSNRYYMLRPDELKGAVSKIAHEPEVYRQQPKVTYAQPKSGYRNNLTKKIEENTNPPLPPVAISRSVPPAPSPVGGGGLSFHDFEKLWEAYPRKDAKDAAERIYKQLLRFKQLPPLPDLLAAVTRFTLTPSWQKENGRFIPYLSNFLQKRRWLDPLFDEEEEANRKRFEAEQLELAHNRKEEAAEARSREKRERLRPIYDAFAARFGEESRQVNESQDNMRFGKWRHLHEKYGGLTAADVPDGNTLCLFDFMTAYQHRRDAEAYQAAQRASAPIHESHSDNRERKPMSCAEVLRPATNFMAQFFPAPQPLCAAAV